MSVYFETYQTVIQSTNLAEFSFGLTEGSFLQLNGQKSLRSVAEDLISDKQKEQNEFIKNSEGTDSTWTVLATVISLFQIFDLS